MEEEEDEEDGGLGGECGGAVFRVGVVQEHVVHVVGTDAADQLTENALVDVVATREVFFGVAIGHLLGGAAGRAEQAGDFDGLLLTSTLVTNVRDNQEFTSFARDFRVEKKKHHTKEIVDFTQELLSSRMSKNALDGVGDVETFLNVFHESIQLKQVPVNTTEQFEKALEKLHVSVTEFLIALQEGG